ncbi:MAG: hypothetical protein WC677_05130 [Clostridia bacterium]|jgi:hypothetical protein
MDKNVLLNELYDSIDSRKHFVKVIKQTKEEAVGDYSLTLKQLEVDGIIMYAECDIHKDANGNLIRIRGWIK